ncbi:type II toxin-antitoxin system RelE/ParE family toxin, partial [Lacticaseibacillus paracasei]
SFSKNFKRIPPYIQKQTLEILKILNECESLESSGVDYKEMEGQKKDESYYRIRVGGYRIGIELVEPSIIIITILPRGDI